MHACTRVWKISSIVLGLIIVGLGVDSHFNSDWRAVNKRDDPCQQKALNIYGSKDKWCPHIAIEEYFVAITIICFILSVISLGYSFKVEKSTKKMKKLDKYYHCLAALLLIIAGSLYFASAIQTLNMRLQGRNGELQLRTTEKAIAGLLAIVQALIYAVAAFFIGKESSSNETNFNNTMISLNY
ncbi:hypothetical protein Ocin01_18643 [Orchesella cincta]|uniref:Uncharacterized protein n=1 Tax=Orchesella cincta TaxID=48709 RepID=A0A1D2M4Y8_ORCCI|nr:hypothetical protein Ocin01_18643 [Orchesella cincta]